MVLSANGLTVPFGWLPAEYALKRSAPTLRRMLSAMIKRALLPVQRKRTLKTGLVMDANLPRAARCEIGDERRANVRATTAAVFKQEQSNFTTPQEIRTVDDRAALTLSNDQTRAGENRKMRRHGVLRHSHEPGQFPGGNAF